MAEAGQKGSKFAVIKRRDGSTQIVNKFTGNIVRETSASGKQVVRVNVGKDSSSKGRVGNITTLSKIQTQQKLNQTAKDYTTYREALRAAQIAEARAREEQRQQRARAAFTSVLRQRTPTGRETRIFEEQALNKRLENAPYKRVIIRTVRETTPPKPKNLQQQIEKQDRNIDRLQQQVIRKQLKGESTAALEAQIAGIAFATTLARNVQGFISLPSTIKYFKENPAEIKKIPDSISKSLLKFGYIARTSPSQAIGVIGGEIVFLYGSGKAISAAAKLVGKAGTTLAKLPAVIKVGNVIKLGAYKLTVVGKIAKKAAKAVVRIAKKKATLNKLTKARKAGFPTKATISTSKRVLAKQLVNAEIAKITRTAAFKNSRAVLEKISKSLKNAKQRIIFYRELNKIRLSYAKFVVTSTFKRFIERIVIKQIKSIENSLKAVRGRISLKVTEIKILKQLITQKVSIYLNRKLRVIAQAISKKRNLTINFIQRELKKLNAEVTKFYKTAATYKTALKTALKLKTKQALIKAKQPALKLKEKLSPSVKKVLQAIKRRETLTVNLVKSKKNIIQYRVKIAKNRAVTFLEAKTVGAKVRFITKQKQILDSLKRVTKYKQILAAKDRLLYKKYIKLSSGAKGSASGVVVRKSRIRSLSTAIKKRFNKLGVPKYLREAYNKVNIKRFIKNYERSIDAKIAKELRLAKTVARKRGLRALRKQFKQSTNNLLNEQLLDNIVNDPRGLATRLSKLKEAEKILQQSGLTISGQGAQTVNLGGLRVTKFVKSKNGRVTSKRVFTAKEILKSTGTQGGQAQTSGGQVLLQKTINKKSLAKAVQQYKNTIQKAPKVSIKAKTIVITKGKAAVSISRASRIGQQIEKIARNALFVAVKLRPSKQSVFIVNKQILGLAKQYKQVTEQALARAPKFKQGQRQAQAQAQANTQAYVQRARQILRTAKVKTPKKIVDIIKKNKDPTKTEKEYLKKFVKKLPTKYRPSFSAVLFGITGYKIPKSITGFEIRPVIIRRNKRK